MNLKKHLNAIGVSAKYMGDLSFDTLGLITSDFSKNMCAFVDSEKYAASLSPSVKIVLTTEALAPLFSDRGVAIVENPRLVFFALHNHMASDASYIRPSFPTIIGKGSRIHSMAYVAASNVRIGDNVLIEEFVSIKENVVIGDNSIIRAGTVVGGEGFEFKRLVSGMMSVVHLGGVVIGSEVELQQGNMVDKAVYPLDNTQIGDFCKTDNHVHIAHATKLDRSVLVAASTCIAGRVVIGENTWIGPGVTISNGLRIGANARVNIGGVVTKDIADGESVTGNFAIDHAKFIRNIKILNSENISKSIIETT